VTYVTHGSNNTADNITRRHMGLSHVRHCTTCLLLCSPLYLEYASSCVYALLASPLPGRLRANMTSFTKPEVHNVHYCQRKTKPRPQLTRTKISCSLDVWFLRHASEQSCRQTDIKTCSSHTSHPYGGGRSQGDE